MSEFYRNYLAVAVFIFAALLMVGAMLGVGRLVRPSRPRAEKLLPYEGVDYFRAHLPQHATVEVVKGFGHIPQMERPVQLVKRLIAFADQHSL